LTKYLMSNLKGQYSNDFSNIHISKQSMVAHLDLICFYCLSVLCVSHDRN
jgi:hypothetical protein